MAGVELATAYINLVPSFRDGPKAISRALDGSAASAGRSSGALAGREFQGALGSSLGGVGSTVQSKLGRPIVSTLDKAGADGARAIEAQLARADLAGSLTAVGGGALLAGGAAVAGFVKAGQAAADLNAAIATSEQVFDSQAAAISTWAKTSSDNFGLSQRAATEAATSFAVFGKAADFAGPELVDFSTSLVELSADFAAFKNTTPEDALTAISAALRGEFDPIEKYGILLNELTLKEKARELGIYEGSAALTSQQKVIAAHAAIMEQSGDITGQFTREQGELGTSTAELAAKWEDAQAAIGQAFLPAMTSAVGLVTDAVDAFRGLPQPLQASLGTLGAIGAVAVTAGGGLALLVGGGMRAVDTFRQFKDRIDAGTGPLSRLSGATRDSAGNLTKFGVAARGAAIGLGTLVVADVVFDILNDGANATGKATDALNELKIASQGAGGNVGDGFAGLVAAEQNTLRLGNLWQEFGAEVELVGTGVKADVEQVQRAFDSIGDTKVQTDVLADLEAATSELDRNSRQYAINTEFIERNRRSLQLAAEARGEALPDTNGITALNSLFTTTASSADVLAYEEEQAAAATEELDAATAGLNRRQALARFAFDSAAAAADGYTSAIERSTNADNLASAALGAGRALRGLRDGFKVEADESEAAKETTDALTVALDKLRDAATNADPKLSALGIRFSTLATAGDAFRDAIANSSLFDDQVSGALRLGDAYRDFRNTFRRLPADIDLNDALMGKYGRRVQEAITNIKELGVAAVDYLATLIKSGRTSEEVQREAARLREEYAAQLRQLGLNEEQINKYLELMGLMPDQVTTAIKVSGTEAARFKINSYLQLLEGKIPENVATQVTAAIERGDLEGAAALLANFAQSNPVPIDIEPEVDEEKVEQAKAKLQPLFDFDFSKLALGQYTDEQMALLDAVLQFGDASTDYIANLAAIEGGQARARAEAEKLREALETELRAQGIPQHVIDQLVELAGLSDEQVNFAITMSGFEETVFKINTLLALIEEDLDPSRKREIAIAIAQGDYDTALALINEDLTALEANGVDIPVEFRFSAEAQRWRQDTGLLFPGEVTVNVNANDDPARDVMVRWRNDVTGVTIVAPVGADPGPGYTEVERFGDAVEGDQSDMPIGANTDPADRTVRAWQAPDKTMNVQAYITGIANIDILNGIFQGPTTPQGPDPGWDRMVPPVGSAEYREWNRRTGGTDGNPRTPYALGGLVGSSFDRKVPAIGTDTVPAMLTPGEFVVTTKGVADVGPAFLDAINRGDFDPARIRGASVGGAARDRFDGPTPPGGHMEDFPRLIDNITGQVTYDHLAKRFPAIFGKNPRYVGNHNLVGVDDKRNGPIRALAAQSIPTPTLQLEAPEQPSAGAQFGDITVVSPNPRLSAEALVRRMDDELWLRS